MHVLKKFFLALALAFILPAPLLAAGDLTLQEKIDFLELAENRLDGERDAWLRDEQQLRDPIWFETTEGLVNFIDGEKLKRKIETMVFLAQMSGFEQTAINRLPFWEQTAAALLNSNQRAEIAVNAVLEKLRKRSAVIRRQTFASYNEMLGDISEALKTARAAQTADPNAGTALIVGTWQMCDTDRVFEFYDTGSGFEGVYLAIAGLEPYGFKVDEIGFRYQYAERPGEYQGKVLWKHTGGANPHWKDTVINVDNDILLFGGGGCESKRLQ